MSATNLTTPPGPEWEGYDMSSIFAPFYWGTMISLVLSGITLLQAYVYFPAKDRIGVQLVAAAMLVLDVTSTALCAEGMYIYLIPQYGSLLPVATLTPTLAIECYTTVIITFLSQLYFAWQIWTVMGTHKMKYAWAGLVLFFGIIAFVAGIACSTIMVIDKANILANRSYRFAVAAGIAKGSASLADILTTIGLCYFLRESRTGFKRTDSLIKSLMGYIVQRGILVTVIQILFLILFFGPSSHLYWLSLHVNVTRLYANTFFAMLNGRKRLKDSDVVSSSNTVVLDSKKNFNSWQVAAPASKTESNYEAALGEKPIHIRASVEDI